MGVICELKMSNELRLSRHVLRVFAGSLYSEVENLRVVELVVTCSRNSTSVSDKKLGVSDRDFITDHAA